MKSVLQKIWQALPAEIRMEIVLCGFLLVIFGIIQIPSLFAHPLVLSHPPEKAWQQIPISEKEIIHGDTSKKQVIFTFDAGGSDASAQEILQVLAKHHVTGTFFMTGKFIEANPQTVKDIVAAGSEVFNHTYDHPYLTTLDEASITDELSKMNATLKATADIESGPLFRPPYGDIDSRVIAAAYKAGYEAVYWTVDARDWMEPSVTADEVKSNILSNISPGTIYLMHVGDSITGSILDEVFTDIEAKGYKIVSLTQGL